MCKKVLIDGSADFISLYNLINIFKEWEMEKLNLIYCKHILGVTKLCTNIAVLSELGRYPLYIDLFMVKQLFMYWYYRLEDSYCLTHSRVSVLILNLSFISLPVLL
jgi:hypothetical protein